MGYLTTRSDVMKIGDMGKIYSTIGGGYMY
jgi:hypothetical protein